MMLRTASRWTVVAGCVCWLGLAAVPARAQSSSMFGSSSVSNRNSSGFSSPSSGFSGMGGGSGFGGMGSGFGGLGGSGGLGGFGGTSGFGGSNSFGNNRGGFGAAGQGTGFGNQANAQGGFVGRNTNPNQFIGLNTLTGGNTGMNASGQFPFGGQGNRNNNFSQFQNLNNQNQNSQGQNQPAQLRARQKIAFTFTKPPADAFQSQVQARFDKLSERNAGLRSVSLVTEPAGVVVLQGEVASESDARLAEKLVRLEPGVRAIRSELTFPPTVDAE